MLVRNIDHRVRLRGHFVPVFQVAELFKYWMDDGEAFPNIGVRKSGNRFVFS